MKKDKNPKVNRPPVVTFLGHVDHGKTTILDKIRKTSVQESEVGGITQGISIYSVNYNDKDITFVDTPGHEAFDLMRMRGGEVADIALLVVAAADGVKPQTKESIEIIKKSKTNCIVVLNKIDIKGVKLEKIKRQLSVEGISVESMGGDVPCLEVSGKTGKGIDDLLNMINLVVEVNGLDEKPCPEGTSGYGVVLESTKDESMGMVTTVIVLSGAFKKGCYVSYEIGKSDKIKGFLDSNGNPQGEIKAGYGGKLLGLSEILNAGDKIYCIENTKGDYSKLFQPVPEKPIVEKEEPKSEEDLLSALLGDSEEKSEDQSLNVLVKSCSQGSLEAVLKSIDKMNKKEQLINVIKSGVGDITVSDIEYAKDSKAIIAGFSVGVDRASRDLAEKEKVIIRTYKVIYELLKELEEAGISLQSPEEEEEIVGTGTVKQVFVLSDGKKVIGTRVDSGEIKNGMRFRVIRGEDVITDSKIISMRCGKDKIDKAAKGIECGIIISKKGDFEEGDKVECYRIVKV